jgi:hypothetical protein
MLDFTKVPKKFLNVKLIDGNTILVRMPTKRIFDVLMNLQNNLSNLKLDDKEQVDFIYGLTSEILSNNLKNEKIDSEYLSGLLDVEDIQILFNSYLNFVTGHTIDPNSKSPQSQEKEMEGNNTTDAQPNGND